MLLPVPGLRCSRERPAMCEGRLHGVVMRGSPGRRALTRCLQWRWVNQLQRRACVTCLFWKWWPLRLFTSLEFGYFLLLGTDIFRSGNWHSFLYAAPLLDPVFYRGVWLRYQYRQLFCDAQTGMGIMVNSATGQQLWLWLCRSHGESRSKVKASVRCLAGGRRLPLRTLRRRLSSRWCCTTSDN